MVSLGGQGRVTEIVKPVSEDDEWAEAVNSPTKRFVENSAGGLVICGLNWGGDPAGPATGDEPRSFFSDPRVNRAPYRDRLVSWFGRLGHPLSTEVAGPFERSIIQTNWLSGAYFQSRNMTGKLGSLLDATILADVVRRFRLLRPRLIVFAGITVFDAFSTCHSSFEDVIGRPSGRGKALWWQPPPPRTIRRRSAWAEYGQCNIIGLPHPTGQSAIPNAAINSFRCELGELIGRFKEQLLKNRVAKA